MESSIASRGYKEALPGTWIQLKEKMLQLQQAGRVWLPIGGYKRIAGECGITGIMLVVVTKFLHETGGIRFFGDMNSIPQLAEDEEDGETPGESESGSMDMLQRTVFISAPWMVSVLKGLVRHERAVLLDYFSRNKPMSRRVQRCVAPAALDVVPFAGKPCRQADAWDKSKCAPTVIL